jgi:hypothetical protein
MIAMYTSARKLMIVMKFFLVFFMSFSITVSAGTRALTITLSLDSVELKKAIEETQAKTSIRFLYNESILPAGKKISISAKDMPVSEFLSRFFKGTGVGYKVMENNLVVLTSETGSQINAADRQITGKISDESGQPIAGASISIKGTAGGTISEASGSFTLTVPDNGVLVISALGYEPLEIQVAGRTDFNFYLRQAINHRTRS